VEKGEPRWRAGLIRDLIGDVQTYVDSKRIYMDLGIPYRRGYLLAGWLGTGKSNLILAVASHFKLPILFSAQTLAFRRRNDE